MLPDEVVAEHLVPALRSLLIRDLLGRGRSETWVAERLGISQSAVSKYKGGGVRVSPLLADDPRVREAAREVAEGLDTGRPRLELLARLVDLTRELENRGPVCALHEEAVPWLQGLGCTLCVATPGDRVLEEQVVLADLRRALAALSNLEGLAELVPNVGSNLAFALEGATELEEVAAVPGRIYRIRGQVRVPGPPEFGPSRHVAEVVLALMAVDPWMRSAINLAWIPTVQAAWERLGWRALEVDAAYEGRRDRIREAVRSSGIPHVVYHRGAYGIEPIAYVGGRTPDEVVARVGRLLVTLRGSRR